MGQLIKGQWHLSDDVPYDIDGQTPIAQRTFRNFISPDGTAGPTGDGGFSAEASRYHLYVSLACPWAHRTLMMRSLKRLESAISVSVVHWLMQENGWNFEDGPRVVADPGGARHLHDIYLAADPECTARATVPILWDKARGTIVSNDSADIVRMLNSAFDGVGAAPLDLYPKAMRLEIDELSARIFASVNAGVYRAGFADDQATYEAAVVSLFDSLAWLDARLSASRYLCGEDLTEADVLLWPTLIRFDCVYYGHFKCNLKRITDYPNLDRYTHDIYELPGMAETVNFDHIKRHYYESHRMLNPSGIVPLGPLPFGRRRP